MGGTLQAPTLRKGRINGSMRRENHQFGLQFWTAIQLRIPRCVPAHKETSNRVLVFHAFVAKIRKVKK